MADLPEKSYDPFDSTLVFVSRKDDLDPFSSEDGPLRAQMSCGHAVTPDSLTAWSRHQLDQGNYKFKCPALVEGTTTKCNKPWSYQEVRRLADLSVEEMQYFEENIARMAAAEYTEIQPCTQCNTNVERKDLTNLCVQCPICSTPQKCYQFCWQCQRQWKGRGPRSDRCDNVGCTNKNLELLQTCKTVDLPEVQDAINCPSVRACPNCGAIVEHSRKLCKNLICPCCSLEFCFICLETKKKCNSTSDPYNLCQGGVAPRQTSIPVWNQNRNRRERCDLISVQRRMFKELYLHKCRKGLRFFK